MCFGLQVDISHRRSHFNICFFVVPLDSQSSGSFLDAVTFDWNAVATLCVWMMTLFIQRSTRRDTLALHAKLDELLRVDNDARTELTRLDEQEPEDIKKHRDTEVRKTTAP